MRLRRPAPFRFMHWAKTTVGRYPYCLGSSGVPAPDPAEFPPAPSEYAGPDYYGIASLKAAIASAHGVDEERVLVSGGTSLLVEAPTYPVIDSIPAYHGVAVDRFERRPEDGWLPDVDELRRLATAPGREPVSAIVLTRLHNPSGADVPVDRIEAIAALAEEVDALVLWDEVYLDILPAATPAHRLSERFVSTGSLTKVYGFGGLRVGGVIGPPDVLEPMKELSFYLEVDTARPSQETGV